VSGKPRSALITGATGLVGSHIAEQLVASGWHVRGLVRPGSDGAMLLELGVEPIIGDVLDARAFAEAASGTDVIFHTAAVITQRSNWDTYRRVNIDGTRNAIDAAERSGARLLQLSSVAVYGPRGRYAGGGRKTSEDTPLGPLPERAFYARSKRESEQLVFEAQRAGRIWATAVRPSVIYGRRDRQFVPRLARLLERGFMPLIGGGRAIFAVVEASNVADGAILAATKDVALGRPYNLANDFDIAVAEFCRLAAEGLGTRVRFVPVPRALAVALLRAAKTTARLLTAGRMSVVSQVSVDFVSRDNPFTSDRARYELGWSPTVRPSEAVPSAFRWWRSHHRVRGKQQGRDSVAP
jgi:nucleoside-diphosphate-sugar epimerase